MNRYWLMIVVAAFFEVMWVIGLICRSDLVVDRHDHRDYPQFLSFDRIRQKTAGRECLCRICRAWYSRDSDYGNSIF